MEYNPYLWMDDIGGTPSLGNPGLVISFVAAVYPNPTHLTTYETECLSGAHVIHCRKEFSNLKCPLLYPSNFWPLLRLILHGRFWPLMYSIFFCKVMPFCSTLRHVVFEGRLKNHRCWKWMDQDDWKVQQKGSWIDFSFESMGKAPHLDHPSLEIVMWLEIKNA